MRNNNNIKMEESVKADDNGVYDPTMMERPGNDYAKYQLCDIKDKEL